jgi:hypothetical protein
MGMGSNNSRCAVGLSINNDKFSYYLPSYSLTRQHFPTSGWEDAYFCVCHTSKDDYGNTEHCPNEKPLLRNCRIPHGAEISSSMRRLVIFLVSAQTLDIIVVFDGPTSHYTTIVPWIVPLLPTFLFRRIARLSMLVSSMCFSNTCSVGFSLGVSSFQFKQKHRLCHSIALSHCCWWSDLVSQLLWTLSLYSFTFHSTSPPLLH